MADPGRDAVVIFNLGLHDLRHGRRTPDEIAAVVATIASLPAFASPAARSSGALIWRSMTPMEVPRISATETMTVPLQRAYDDAVTALWRSHGFPVADIQGLVMGDDSGDLRRKITIDSIHPPRHIDQIIYSYVLAQACDLLQARRAARLTP